MPGQREAPLTATLTLRLLARGRRESRKPTEERPPVRGSHASDDAAEHSLTPDAKLADQRFAIVGKRQGHDAAVGWVAAVSFPGDQSRHHETVAQPAGGRRDGAQLLREAGQLQRAVAVQREQHPQLDWRDPMRDVVVRLHPQRDERLSSGLNAARRATGIRGVAPRPGLHVCQGVTKVRMTKPRGSGFREVG